MELEFILKGQRRDGFIPHIIFHQESDDYFPGPDTWGATAEDGVVPGSKISQPPILAWGYWLLYQASNTKEQRIKRIKEIFPRLCQHYLWWIQNRQIKDRPGLISSIHPWETGMDNSPVWDEPMKQVPVYKGEYARKDIGLVDMAERPTKDEYDRYLYLVKLLSDGKSDKEMANDGPFSVYDVCIISLFHRSCKALLALGAEINMDPPMAIKQFMVETSKNINKLWLGDKGYFSTWDALADKPLPHKISACFLPLFAGLASKEQAKMMNEVLQDILAEVKYGIPSTAASDAKYDSCRYWRGPVWFHINWMIAQGLEQYGYNDTAKRLKQDMQKLAARSGFYEYYDSANGKGCGGGDFSWTAATYLVWD